MKKVLRVLLFLAILASMMSVAFANSSFGPVNNMPPSKSIYNVIIEMIQWVGYFVAVIVVIISTKKFISKMMKNNEGDIEALKKEKKESVNKLISGIAVSFLIFLIATFFGILFDFAEKPIIYLYPEQETNVSVVLGNPQNITCSYPKYIDGWNVTAKPNGDLVDLDTGRNLYALYWEGKGTSKKKGFEEGFCVKGEDTASFLEEKLAILGLNEREAEEFIVYWLPRLEANRYNLIRFQTMEEINRFMPLEITPKPDTTIRVMMEWKGISHYKELPEQKLVTPERVGFVAVEWGGTER